MFNVRTGRGSLVTALTRAISVSASSRSWCASAGLGVVTQTLEPLTWIVSHSEARLSPRTSRSACRTRYCASRPARCWPARTRGRTLLSLSTALHRPPLDAHHLRSPYHAGGKRVGLDRGDYDLT